MVYEPCFCGAAMTSASSAVTVRYFPKLEISQRNAITHSCSLCLPLLNHMHMIPGCDKITTHAPTCIRLVSNKSVFCLFLQKTFDYWCLLILCIIAFFFFKFQSDETCDWLRVYLLFSTHIDLYSLSPCPRVTINNRVLCFFI